VSINSEEVHISLRAAASGLAKGRGSMKSILQVQHSLSGSPLTCLARAKEEPPCHRYGHISDAAYPIPEL
jgi:hypothetical protein